MIKNLNANKIRKNNKIWQKFASINRSKIILIFLICLCLVFILNPAYYSNSCLNAISVWATKVLPVLLPFFVLTRIIIRLMPTKPTGLDKLFFKIYDAPTGSATIFLLAVLSGYPMGAKLICDNFERGLCSQDEAKRMLAFCSISGPMFIIGSVGVMIFNNFKLGLLALIANILASLINGLIYRKVGIKASKANAMVRTTKDNQQPASELKTHMVMDASKQNDIEPNLLSNSVYDAMISILTVCVYMVLAFLIIDVMKNFKILDYISHFFSNCFGWDKGFVQAILCGMMELTNGIIALSKLCASPAANLMMCSYLIGFGGICVLLQSRAFLAKLNIKSSFLLLQKLTQGLLALIISIPLCAFL